MTVGLYVMFIWVFANLNLLQQWTFFWFQRNALLYHCDVIGMQIQ
jgi:hypothetical protein